jgi:hypothetical protein
LAGLDAVHAGSIFADEIGGELYLQVYVALPNRAGDDFVAHLITLAHVKDVLLAQINRNALIMALETHFGRVQISSSELAMAKYCQKEWPSDSINQVVAGLISRREIRQPDQERLNVLATIGSQIGQFIERKHAEEALRASEAKFRQQLTG